MSAQLDPARARRSVIAASLAVLVPGFFFLTAQSCTSKSPPSPAAGATFCSLPGSVVWTAQGSSVVAGGDAAATDVSWLSVPAGFCVHYFATLGHVRQLKFAPGGDLFAASPSTATAGGNSVAGHSNLSVLPDDDQDGFADTTTEFLGSLPSTQGLLFANGLLYYQDGATIRSIPFRARDRSPSGPSQVVTTITAPQDEVHWPKVMDRARDGTLYITNGGSQNDQCLSAEPTRGAIFALEDGGATSLVAKGFRNPIAIRCETSHDVCLALELGLDFSSDRAGREKLVPVRTGDDWGFPCCATKDIAYEGTVYSGTSTTPDCSAVTAESDSFVIGQTPFGLDFELGKWPAPWTNRVFVTLHGQVGTWHGAGVVGLSLDPSTGMPLPATDLPDAAPNESVPSMFASGWDDGRLDHGRPAPITFAPDGRMFVGDDATGLIVWIAPVDLPRH